MNPTLVKFVAPTSTSCSGFSDSIFKAISAVFLKGINFQIPLLVTPRHFSKAWSEAEAFLLSPFLSSLCFNSWGLIDHMFLQKDSVLRASLALAGVNLDPVDPPPPKRVPNLLESWFVWAGQCNLSSGQQYRFRVKDLAWPSLNLVLETFL